MSKKNDIQYTLKDIAKHNTTNDAWISIDGEVYDITKFVKLHPGGKDILLSHLGKDVTEEFVSDKIHAHSKRALNIASKYKIGRLSNSISSNSGIFEKHPLEGLVDMDKAILPQILHMNPPDLYQEWLHGASTGTSTIRIFQSNTLELLTHWPWWYIFPLWIPVICFMLYSSYLIHHSIVKNALVFVLGLLVWGLMEYIAHRWIFHYPSKTKTANFIHFFSHGIHHLTPLDTSRLTFPPPFSMAIGLVVYKAFINLLPYFNAVHALYAGVACGYMLYDAIHYYFHHGEAFVWFKYLQYMKVRHMDHHYKNPNGNFGVSSPIFDFVFGTSV